MTCYDIPVLDFDAWLAVNVQESVMPANPPANPPSAAQRSQGRDERSHRIYRAAAYLNAVSPAVAGQNGHGQTFDAACALIKGFGLTVGESRPILAEWNQRCLPPWSVAEMEHKLVDADDKPDDKARGYLFDEEGKADRPQDLARIYGAALNVGAGMGNGAANGVVNGYANGHPNGTGAGIIDTAQCSIGQEDDPHRLARLFIDSRYRHHDGLALRFWREDFHGWNGSHYLRMPRKEIAAMITRELESEFQRIHEHELMLYAMRRARPGQGGDGENGDGPGGKPKSKLGRPTGPPKKRGVTTRLVGDVTQALSDLTLVRASDVPSQPEWLDYAPIASSWLAKEILPTKNSIVHLSSFVDDKFYMRPPTPLFFAPYSLNYSFDPGFPPPTKWLEFLNQLWGDDTESISLLQEWIGHLLTPDTSQQKIMMLIGPKRSGKGTIVRVIRALIGSENVVNPTLSSLATNFGLAPLIGKTAAIITDARISGRTDTAVVIERLLTISGEDALEVDRKYRDPVETEISARFMIVSNELPRVKDASAALAGRMLFLRLTRSFYGQEDTGLLSSLLPELPGILLWAIEGWARLRERGRFVQSKDGRDLAATMQDLCSPITSFMQNCCKVDPDDKSCRSPVADLYLRWRNWCSEKGQENYGNEEEFGRNLRAALPHVKKIRPTIGDKRVWCYRGIRLLEPWEASENQEEYDEDGEEIIMEDRAPF